MYKPPLKPILHLNTIILSFIRIKENQEIKCAFDSFGSKSIFKYPNILKNEQIEPRIIPIPKQKHD